MDPLTIIALITASLTTIEQLTAFLEKLRATSQQSGEWTEEQEKAFNDLQAQRAASPRWQPKGK